MKTGQKNKVAIIGAGPAGMTIALLLSKNGHSVTLFEAKDNVGGLWSVQLSKKGYYVGENSCKVYQGDYKTAPVLFSMIGTKWQNHFTPHFDLRVDWLRPFIRDCSVSDLCKFTSSFLLDTFHLKSYRGISAEEYLKQNNFSEKCCAWLRATALGGITGTLKMSIWEFHHRIRANLFSIFGNESATLYWNKQPPNSKEGFVTKWKKTLVDEGVTISTKTPVEKLSSKSPSSVTVSLKGGKNFLFDAVFLAVPPPALSTILSNSPNTIAQSFGHSKKHIQKFLKDSVYQHLGIAWYFDKPLPQIPLGGNTVRKGWHPILVEFPQYEKFLKPPAKTVVVGSVSLVTSFLHHRLGKKVQNYSHDEIAKIVWDDEMREDPRLPKPIGMKTLGISSATQIVSHGTLPVKSSTLPIYIGTNLNGKSPYFTSSLEAAIQAGNAAARAFDPTVTQFPM